MTDAELRESAERKRLDAQTEILSALSKLTPEQIDELNGFQFTYSITLAEYKAQFGKITAK